MTWLFLYLAFFFCALVAYDTLLLNQYAVEYWNFGFALLNAAVITKVIMIGEYAKLGSRHESKPLFISAAWKALVFGLLVFAFHVVEEIVKRLIHGANVESASRHIRFDQLRQQRHYGVLHLHPAIRLPRVSPRDGRRRVSEPGIRAGEKVSLCPVATQVSSS